MDIRIYDNQFNFKGIVDIYKSLEWSPRYNDIGTFKLTCIDKTYFSLLKTDRWVINPADLDYAGVIENISLSENILTGEDELIVSGRMLESLLDRRIVLTDIYSDSINPSTLISEALIQNVISPEDNSRKISNLSIAGLAVSENVSAELSKENLLDGITSLASASEFGFRLYFDESDKSLKFKTYLGLDRTLSQSLNKRVVLSKNYDNVIEMDYSKNITNHKTYVHIIGVDNITTYLTIGSETGLDRKETLLDLSSVAKSTTNTEGVETTLSDSEYIEVLRQNALETITSMIIEELISSTLNLYSNLVYKTDFNIGDIVTCFEPTLGLSVDLRISGVDQVWDNSGYSIALSLGKEISTVKKTIYTIVNGIVKASATTQGNIFGGTASTVY